MTPAEIDSFARASAQAIGLTLGEDDLARVAAQLAILFEHAGNVAQADLPPDLEPLTVFEP